MNAELVVVVVVLLLLGQERFPSAFGDIERGPQENVSY